METSPATLELPPHSTPSNSLPAVDTNRIFSKEVLDSTLISVLVVTLHDEAIWISPYIKTQIMPYGKRNLPDACSTC
jgi:hypothetical protein